MSVKDKVKQTASLVKDNAKKLFDSAKMVTTPIIEPIRHQANKVKNDLQTKWDFLKLKAEQTCTNLKYYALVKTRDPTFTDSIHYIYDQGELALRKAQAVSKSANRAWDEEIRHGQAMDDYRRNVLVDEDRHDKCYHNDDL